LDKGVLTDEQLAAAAAREDSDGPAFVALLDRFQQPVWRTCFRLMSDEHEAEDAAQEVFVRLFMQRKSFRGDSKYATWVYAIAVRTCLAMRRQRGRRQRREAARGGEEARRRDEATGTSPADASLDLDRMLETLDEDGRALLIMKYAEERSYDELAEVFGLSVSACKMRISRARDKLKQQFPEHEISARTSDTLELSPRTGE
jgi:RNA polymerase sigma-70 factor (ECF subfamily)